MKSGLRSEREPIPDIRYNNNQIKMKESACKRGKRERERDERFQFKTNIVSHDFT